MQSEAKTVDGYLKEVPDGRRAALERLRELCLETLDGYEESMSYGMPGYSRLGEEIEVAFASQKNYISLYILRQEIMDKHRPALAGLNLGKGCIRYRKPEQIDFEVVKLLLTDSLNAEGEIC